MSNMSMSPALSLARINMSTQNSQASGDYTMLSQSSLDNSRLARHPLRNRYSNYPPYRIHTHHITLSLGTDRLSSSPLGDNDSSEENSNPCIMDESNEVRYSSLDRGQLGIPRRDSFDYFPLNFDVVQTDGGHFSPAYSVQNILRDDNSVYCSGRRGTINILLKFNGPETGESRYGNLPCVLAQLIIRSPRQGFTAPCKEGMVFISQNPIDLKATERFDNFTKEDFISHSAVIRNLKTDNRKDFDTEPVAWFQVKRDNQQCVDLAERSGRYVLLKLLRSEHTAENIDLQYVGLMGYFGARSFAIGTLC